MIEGSDSSGPIGTRQQAYKDDQISCSACKTVGKIVCDGPRIPATGPDGRQPALSDNLRVCQC
ncbi:hypothetical protein ACTXHA_37855 [Burkholderia cenocepacia]